LIDDEKIDNPFQFDPNEGIGWFCTDIYKNKMSYISKCSKITSITIPSSFGIIIQNIQSQWIDIYGKVRIIVVTVGNTAVAVQTTPLPPFATIPSLEQIPIELFPNEFDAQQFISEYVITNSRATMHDTSFTVGNVQMRLSYKNSQTTSVYNTFITNYSISRYMKNWIIYLYSEYLASFTVYATTMSNFVSSYITVDENIIYTRPTSELFDKSIASADGFMKGGVLVCNSVELRNRLIFILRLLLTRNPDKVKDFKNKTYMDKFYVSVSNFKEHPLEYIFTYSPEYPIGFKTLMNQKDTAPLHTDPTTQRSYFLKNLSVANDEIVHVQNFNELSKIVDEKIDYVAYIEDDMYFVSNRNDTQPTDQTPRILISKLGNNIYFGKIENTCE